jgi:hypothetical protein
MDTHNINIPLKTSVTPKAVKNWQKRGYNIKPKQGTTEPMLSPHSDTNTEATTGLQLENVKTVTPKHQIHKKPDNSRTRKHKNQSSIHTDSGGNIESGGDTITSNQAAGCPRLSQNGTEYYQFGGAQRALDRGDSHHNGDRGDHARDLASLICSTTILDYLQSVRQYIG